VAPKKTNASEWGIFIMGPSAILAKRMAMAIRH
jgi:hypothetical protein